MATKPLCSIHDCDKPHFARSWCKMHYARWMRHGDPMALKMTDRGEPFRYLCDVVLPYSEDGCLMWPYNRSSAGYGGIHMGGGRRSVHRIVCEYIHGAPPTREHQAAHSCGKGHLGCVNPKHLRWATPAENQADRIIHGTHSRGRRIRVYDTETAYIPGLWWSVGYDRR